MLSDDVPLVISRRSCRRCARAAGCPREAQGDGGFRLEKTVRGRFLRGAGERVCEGQAANRTRRRRSGPRRLAGIDLDSGIRVLDEYNEVRRSPRYLEDDDALNADMFIKKASFLLAVQVRVQRRAPVIAIPTTTHPFFSLDR